ncbi:MAG: hypothetical protein NWF06_08440 [Candidatus Bathyarchaeota archaeon]|nr:hypothetical protein [Candidatus Bathyarchaeum sp.]
MEPKNLKSIHKKTRKNVTNAATHNYNTVAAVNSRFSSLVSSGTIYSIRYYQKKKAY